MDSIMIVSTNITSEKQADNTLEFALNDMETQFEKRTAELFQSEERFSLAMSGANDGLWDWDLVTGLVYFSPRYWSMLGYEEVEKIGTFDTFQILIHPDDIENIENQLAPVLEGKSQNYSAEFRAIHTSGEYIHILARGHSIRNKEGKVVRMVGTHLDITESKKSAEKLKESEKCTYSA